MTLSFHCVVASYVPVQVFEHELEKRKSNIDSIQKAAKTMIENSDEDTTLLQAQLIDLTTKCDKVSSLSANKRDRLADAYAEVSFALFCGACSTNR